MSGTSGMGGDGGGQESGQGWDLQVGPKKPKAAAKPEATGAGGTEELPGTPRRAPGPTSEDPNKGKKAAAASEDFSKQRPGGVEEDAEVYVAPHKGGAGWTTPSGKVVDPGSAPAKPAGQGGAPGAPTNEKGEAVLHEDDDVEVTSSPRRPESSAPPPLSLKGLGGKGGMMPSRAAAAGAAGKGGVDDSEMYVRKPGESSIRSSGKEYVMPGSSLARGNSDTIEYPSSGSLGKPGPKPTSWLPGGGASPIANSGTPAAGLPSGAGSQGLSSAPRGPPHKGLPGRVLLVGGGGREHAMAAALRRCGAEVYAVLKHRNPGIVKLAAGFRLLSETDVPAVVDWARSQKVEVAVIGPEAPLAAGLSDALAANGIPVASPSQAAARIESDKTFMRALMAKHDLPGRLAHHPFDRLEDALRFLDQKGPVWAIKPVGLTGGKGVQVYGDHFVDVAGAKAYVQSIFQGKVGGGRVQFEELARGEEFTLMAFCDGTNLAPMPAVQDHKRLRDGDQGPNTGGMGSYSQQDGLLPFLTLPEYMEGVRILQAIVDALRKEGTPYVGAIYGQFMLTVDGPKVIEVNARFGDPEAMNVLHLLDANYLDLLRAMVLGRLPEVPAAFRPRATVVKYVVPRGYGDGTPQSGSFVQVDEFNIKRLGPAAVYYANIEQLTSGSLSTMSSRTLGIVGEGDSIEEANALCEAALRHVHGDHLFVRHDIGSPELLRRRVENMEALRRGEGPPLGAAMRRPAQTYL